MQEDKWKQYGGYIITYNKNQIQIFAKHIFLKHLFIERIKIINCKIYISLRIAQSISSFQNLIETSGYIETTTKTFIKTITNHSFELIRETKLKQPKQKNNYIVTFANGVYLQKPVVHWVFSNILNNMNTHSKKREHLFDPILAKKKLLEALENIPFDFKCGCRRNHCNETMQLFGENGISPDRKFDDKSYIDPSQIINFVIKKHNTYHKFDDIPIKMKHPTSWVNAISKNMINSTKDRIEKLKLKIKYTTQNEKKQILKYDTMNLNADFYIESLLKKKLEQKELCYKCNIKLYFGDENGIMRFIVGNKASPDRIDNNNCFYNDNNYHLVCVSCNYVENSNYRIHILNRAKNNPIFFTIALLEECKKWLI